MARLRRYVPFRSRTREWQGGIAVHIGRDLKQALPRTEFVRIPYVGFRLHGKQKTSQVRNPWLASSHFLIACVEPRWLPVSF